MARPRSGEVETEEWVEQDAAEALTGSAPGTDTDDELAGILADMACGALKLGMLLAECDEDRWRSVRARLDLFRNLVNQLPTGANPRRRIGFRPVIDRNRSAKRVRRR